MGLQRVGHDRVTTEHRNKEFRVIILKMLTKLQENTGKSMKSEKYKKFNKELENTYTHKKTKEKFWS